jgi:hypothetical protein
MSYLSISATCPACFILHYTITLIQYTTKLLRADPFWLRKITTNPHILAHVNRECADDKYPKLKILKSELILDSY